MRTGSRIVLVVVVIGIAIQFIQPVRNVNGMETNADMIKQLNVPANIAAVLKTSCYDCHSNHTVYPWYSGIQPFGWLLAKHIKDGKAELNFSEFGNYSQRKKLSKLKSVLNSVKDGTMPLSSYTFIHKNAILSKENRALLIDWISKTIDSISVKVEGNE